MPGTIPGAFGLAAFASIKFVGYSLALSALKKREPTIKARPMTIAAVRTVLGAILGPLATMLILFLIGLVIIHPDAPPRWVSWSLDLPAIYGMLFLIRICVWALVLFLFTATAPLGKSRLWQYAFTGAIVSTLLDWPGYALALAAPGKIAFC